MSLWVDVPDRGRTVWVLAETDLRVDRLRRGPRRRAHPGQRRAARGRAAHALQLRVVTSVIDSAVAAQVAENIEESLRDLVGHCRIAIEAERHWADPYHYELDVAVEPYGDPVEALQIVAEAGGDGWLSVLDDGWRCNLWWSRPDEDSIFLAPEISGRRGVVPAVGRPVAAAGVGAPARRRRGRRRLRRPVR